MKASASIDARSPIAFGFKDVMQTPPTRTSHVSTIKLALAIARQSGATELDYINQKRLATLMKHSPTTPFQRLTPRRGLPVIKAVDLVENDEECTDTTHSLSEASITGAPLYPSSPEETARLSESISTLSSTSTRDNSLHSQEHGIKAKINLYENMTNNAAGKPRPTFKQYNCPDDFDHKLYPTMKLRDTNSESQDQPYQQEISEQIVSDVSLSPGQSLSLPNGSGKQRKVSYRIRFTAPGQDNREETMDHNENDGFNTPAKNCGGIRGVRGYNRSNNWFTLSDAELNSVNKDKCNCDDCHKVEQTTANNEETVDEESDDMSESSYNDFDRPPDVWITPIKSKDGSQKWIAKRVWDIEDKDDEEPEYEVDHSCLMRGVRGLMGIPEEMGLIPEEWEVNVDVRNPWEIATSDDAAPILPNRDTNDFATRARKEEKFCNQLLGAVDFPHLELRPEESSYHSEESSPYDSESYASFISLIDYIDFNDSDTSCLESIPTHGSNDDLYQLKSDDEMEQEFGSNQVPHQFSDLLKLSNHCKRGFGRPDEWIRPHDDFEDIPGYQTVWENHQKGFPTCRDCDSPNDTDDGISQSSEDTKLNNHNERGFGRPDDWIRPQEMYEESSECSRSEFAKRYEFGRSNTCVHQDDSSGASTERRSCGSPLVSRTFREKSARRCSPTYISPLRRNKVTLEDYLDFHNSEHTKHMLEDLDGHTSVTRETSKTSSSRYESEEEFKPRTGTLDKNGSVQYDDQEMNVKVWWNI